MKTTAFQAYSLPGGGLVRRKRNLPALAGSGLVSNEAGFRHHDFIPYFSLGPESAYIWTHEKNKNSSLVVNVEISVHDQNVWRNLATILDLTLAISSDFESIGNC